MPSTWSTEEVGRRDECGRRLALSYTSPTNLAVSAMKACSMRTVLKFGDRVTAIRCIPYRQIQKNALYDSYQVCVQTANNMVDVDAFLSQLCTGRLVIYTYYCTMVPGNIHWYDISSYYWLQ